MFALLRVEKKYNLQNVPHNRVPQQVWMGSGMLDQQCLPHAPTSEHASPQQPPPAHQDKPHHTRPHCQNPCGECARQWMPRHIQLPALPFRAGAQEALALQHDKESYKVSYNSIRKALSVMPICALCRPDEYSLISLSRLSHEIGLHHLVPGAVLYAGIPGNLLLSPNILI